MLDHVPFVVTKIGRIRWSWVHDPDDTRSYPTLVNSLDTI
jgi:hypothetical protein